MRWIGPLKANAADTTDDLVFEAIVRALYSGVLFGLVMVLLNGPARGLIAGLLFAVFMGITFVGILLYKRGQARRRQ